MESGKITFTIICNDDKHLAPIIDWYNINYKTDFRILKIVYDEVNFAEIEVSKYRLADLFSLGYQFGVKEQVLRQKGEIDW